MKLADGRRDKVERSEHTGLGHKKIKEKVTSIGNYTIQEG